MAIRLSFRRMFLEPGKIFAVPTVAGARIRVVDGTIWATTSASPHDVWLSAGQEHTMERRGLTVIESVTRASFELIPPSAAKTGGRITSRYDIAIPRTACNLAAIAMTAITIGLFVVVPAKMAAGGTSGSPQRSEIVAMPPGDIVVSRRGPAPTSPGQTFAQAQNGATPRTSVQ
jgi:hypothetical protein